MHVKGLPDSIDPKKPPRNYRDAMSREDKHEWAEAYMAEYQGFLTQGTLKIVKPEKGAKILDTTTRADYIVTNRVSEKRKIRYVSAAISKRKVFTTIQEISMPQS